MLSTPTSKYQAYLRCSTPRLHAKAPGRGPSESLSLLFKNAVACRVTHLLSQTSTTSRHNARRPGANWRVIEPICAISAVSIEALRFRRRRDTDFSFRVGLGGCGQAGKRGSTTITATLTTEEACGRWHRFCGFPTGITLGSYRKGVMHGGQYWPMRVWLGA